MLAYLLTAVDKMNSRDIVIKFNIQKQRHHMLGEIGR